MIFDAATIGLGFFGAISVGITIGLQVCKKPIECCLFRKNCPQK